MNDSSGELPIDDGSDTDIYQDVSEEELIDDRDSSSSDLDDYDDEDDDLGEMCDDEDDTLIFAHPGGNSALRAETEDNPRNLPCPTCQQPNRLTPADVALGYQCDQCADKAERGGDF
jgi:hypothetical protein